MDATQREAPKIDVEKTYNQIVAKREEKLSREALLERQATQLTRYFIRARQRELQDTVERQAEQSRKHYERNLQKARDAGEAAAAVAQMVQEEKIIISTHMAEKGRERLAEEQQVKSARQEREKWQQARILYERFQAEERLRLRQEQEKEKLEKLQDSLKKHDNNILERKQMEAEELKIRRAESMRKETAVLHSRWERQKERQKAAKVVVSKGQRKMEAAQQRRWEMQVKVKEACHEQLETVVQKVDRAEQLREVKRQGLHEALLEKDRLFEERMQKRKEEAEEVEASEGPETKATRGASKESHQVSKAPTEKKDLAVEEPAEVPTTASPPLRYDSKELLMANSRAHKDYLRRCGNLQQAGFDMLTKKQFKVLADAANIREDDAGCKRMRSLHSKYLAENGKGRYRRRPSPQTARDPRRRIPTCGFCERHFPLESLVGSASKRTLQKIKDSGDEMSSQAPTSPTSERAESTAREERLLPGVRLYDQELPLCAACYHRVRICSSSTL